MQTVLWLTKLTESHLVGPQEMQPVPGQADKHATLIWRNGCFTPILFGTSGSIVLPDASDGVHIVNVSID